MLDGKICNHPHERVTGMKEGDVVTAAAAPALEFETIIGLEMHAQTRSRRARCSAVAAPPPSRAEPNANVCPVCMGIPGVLPVINREAVRQAVRVALALHGDVQRESKFDRKNYTYPDLPKGYQISQYDLPAQPRRLRHRRHRRWREAGRHHARAYGGGYGPLRPSHAHRWHWLFARRSQSCGRAAPRDRQRAGYALARGGAAVSEHTPRSAPLHRRLDRQHGGGRAPLRREYLPAAAWRDGIRREGRDQECQLLPGRLPGDPVRGAAAGRRAACGRHADSGDARLVRGSRCDARRNGPKSSRTTTATSPSPICRRSSSRMHSSRRRVSPSPSCRTPAAIAT